MLTHLRPQPQAVLFGIRHRKDVAVAMAFPAIQELDPSDAAVPAAGRTDQALVHHEATVLVGMVIPLDEGHDDGADALDVERERLVTLPRILERDAVHARRWAEACLTRCFHGETSSR